MHTINTISGDHAEARNTGTIVLYQTKGPLSPVFCLRQWPALVTSEKATRMATIGKGRTICFREGLSLITNIWKLAKSLKHEVYCLFQHFC